MSDIEILDKILLDAIKEFDSMDSLSDFERGVRMGYLHCCSLIEIILHDCHE